MRTARMVVAVVMLMLGLTLVVGEAEPASADPADLDIWRNVATGRCLFFNGQTDTGIEDVYMTPSCSAQYEGHLWHVHPADNGDSNDYRIVNTVGGRCLTGNPSEVDGEVWVERCRELSLNQIWELTRYSGNRYTLRNNYTRECLMTGAASGAANVHMGQCWPGLDYQVWVRD